MLLLFVGCRLGLGILGEHRGLGLLGPALSHVVLFWCLLVEEVVIVASIQPILRLNEHICGCRPLLLPPTTAILIRNNRFLHYHGLVISPETGLVACQPHVLSL